MAITTKGIKTVEKNQSTPKGDIYHIYLDESRQSQDRFMVLGGLVIHSESMNRFNETMSNYRDKYNMRAELKWSKVKWQKIDEYKGFVDYFFALNDNNQISFHCIIIDNHKVNHKKHGDGNKDTGINKFFYQLLIHKFAKTYCSDSSGIRLKLYFDYRTSSASLHEFRDILNNGCKKTLGISCRPFISIESPDSKKSEVIQINDILLGAVGYQKNGNHLLSRSGQGKIDLAAYIADKSGLRVLAHNTTSMNKRFSIWNFKLKE